MIAGLVAQTTDVDLQFAQPVAPQRAQAIPVEAAGERRSGYGFYFYGGLRHGRRIGWI
jgi:hypothetical protein